MIILKYLLLTAVLSAPIPLFGTAAAKAGEKAAFFAEQALLAAKTVVAGKPAKSTLRVMTYNVEKLKELDKVIETIHVTNSDLVVMQEVTAKESQVLADKMAAEGYLHKSECMNMRSGGMIGNTIFSKHPIIHSNTYSMMDPYGNRCVVEAIVQVGGQQVLAVGTHLTNAGGGYREAQLQQLTKLSQFRAKEGFIDQVFLGDMNTEKSTVAKHTNGLIDSFGEAVRTKTQWRGKAIDHVLLSDSMAKQSTISSTVIHSDASDHLPIMTDITPNGPIDSRVYPKTIERADGVFGDAKIDPFTQKVQNVAFGVAAASSIIGVTVALTSPPAPQ